MTELFTIAWTSIIAKCFVAIGFVPATRYRQYTTCACLLVTFGACQRKGTVSTSAIRSTVKDINMEKGYISMYEAEKLELRLQFSNALFLERWPPSV